MDFVLPASPNWYCSRVIDCNKRGIACFGSKNSLFWWDFSSKPSKFMSYINAHQERVVGVSLCSSDPPNAEANERGLSRCCTAGEDGKVKIWELGSRIQLDEHGLHKHKLTCVHWSPFDQDLVASGDERGTVVLWNVTLKETWTWQPEFSNCHLFCISFCPSASSLLAVGFKSGNIIIINGSKKNLHVIQHSRGHEDEIHSIAWGPLSNDCLHFEGNHSPGETLIASSSRDKTIRLWTLQSGQSIKTLVLPNNSGHHRREEAGLKARVWVTLCWPPNSPLNLVSSGLNGELLQWNINSRGKAKTQVINPGDATKGHSRIVFNIAVGGPDYKTLISISMDRLIIIWDLESLCSQQMIPTLGGFVYSVDQSPTHPTQLALGVGDSQLRICSCGGSSGYYGVQTFWQGIKAKITAVSWHPKIERLLAYGTEDGTVGIYDVHSTSSPQISSTYHKKSVYGIYWGPPCGEKFGNSDYSLYSIGNGIIYQHKPEKLNQQADDLNVLIQKTNGYQQKLLSHSVLSWNDDCLHVAIGNDDGSIDIYSLPHLKHLCSIHVHKKLVNCLKWHPQFVGESGTNSYHHWLASCSNELVIHVFNLQKVLDKSALDDNTRLATITDSFCRLEGHTSRVMHLCWNPHTHGMLASASFDCTVQVWDVKHHLAVRNYRGHLGHVLCVQWSLLDNDVIYSGSDDHTLHGWKISEQIHTAPISVQEKRKLRVKQRNKGNEIPGEPISDQNSLSHSLSPARSDEALQTCESESVSTNFKDSCQLLILCGQKRQEILAKKEATKIGLIQDTHGSNIVPDYDDGEEILVSTLSSHANDLSSARDSSARKDHRKRRVRSLFPKSSTADNRGKQPSQQDCIDFAKVKYLAAGTMLEENLVHLGCFLNRRNTYALFAEEELYHLEHGNYDQHAILGVFKGDVKSTLQSAVDNGRINDHLLAMAPLVSSDFWEQMCVQYASQLVKEGQFHKATTYYLAANQVYEAINMLKENKFYKDAICLARVRLPPSDPILHDLFLTWGNHMAKDGNYELAAKCFLAINSPKEAIGCLARRPNSLALRAAALVALAADEMELSHLYAQKFVQESILASDWIGASELIRASPFFMVHALPFSVYKVLTHVLESNEILTGIVPASDCEENSSSYSDNLCHLKLPGFLLDMMKVDSFCIWKPLLIDETPFLLYILKIWHEIWNISFSVSGTMKLCEQLLNFHDYKQSQTGDKQMLFEASLNIAICLLKVLLRDFEGSAKFMTDAICLFQDDSRQLLCQALCRLLLPQGPHMFHLLTEQIHAFHVALLDISQLEEFVLQMPSFWIGPTIKTVDEFNTDDIPEIFTSSQQCSDYDALTAVYCIVILKFLLSKKVMVDLDLSFQTADAKDCCCRVTEGMITYQYIFNLAHALLWNVQLQKYELLESEVFIRKAVSSLVSSHRANNQINLSANEFHLQNPEFNVIENDNDLASATFVHDLCETFAYDKDIKESDNGSLTMHSRRLKTILPSGTTIAHKCEPTRNFETLMSVEYAERDEDCMVMKKYQPCTTDYAVTSTIDPYCVDTNSSSEAATSHLTNTCKDALLQVKCSSGDELGTRNVEIQNGANHVKNQDFVRTSNYANVPDEWYSLSVDERYELPYITMIVLQKELNRIKTELSSLPLISNLFPHPLISAKLLIQFVLQCCQAGQSQNICENCINMIQYLCEWGLSHAYTSAWKSFFLSVLDLIDPRNRS